MLSIKGNGVNDIFPVALLHIRESGVQRDSRNGPVLEYPEPVSICYQNPTWRVLFDADRDINPFLHFFEPLWILAGRDDVGFLSNIVSSFKDYSDNGVTFFGAYGHRLAYPHDQIEKAVQLLRANPDDRRVVLQIRRPEDMFYEGKDQPCNTAIACKIRDGKLNIHVFNRSNDLIWGMLGANMPQFGTLQEYMAGKIGCGVGTYHQTTDSMHVYTELNDKWEKCEGKSVFAYCPYKEGDVKSTSLFEGVTDPIDFDEDLFEFFDGKRTGFKTFYFNKVVMPMWNTFEAHKKDRSGTDHVHSIAASDWRKYTLQWLNRRYVK